METDKKEFIYTQEDMDNITNKVRAKEQEKISKNFIEKSTFDELNNKFNSLLHEQKQEKFKNTFIQNGGKEEAYSDFIKNHSELLDMDKDNLKNVFDNLKTEKKFYFNDTETIFSIDDKKVLEDFTGDDSEELYPDSIYKKLKI